MANLRKMLLFKMLLLLFILVACKKKEYIIFIKGLKKVTLVQLFVEYKNISSAFGTCQIVRKNFSIENGNCRTLHCI